MIERTLEDGLLSSLLGFEEEMIRKDRYEVEVERAKELDGPS